MEYAISRCMISKLEIIIMGWDGMVLDAGMVHSCTSYSKRLIFCDSPPLCRQPTVGSSVCAVGSDLSNSKFFELKIFFDNILLL